MDSLINIIATKTADEIAHIDFKQFAENDPMVALIISVLEGEKSELDIGEALLNMNFSQEISKKIEIELGKIKENLMQRNKDRTIIPLRYSTDDVKFTNLKNWLRYRIIPDSKINKKIKKELKLERPAIPVFDCDALIKEDKEVKALLDWENADCFDCVNSVETVWGKFVSRYLAHKYKLPYERNVLKDLYTSDPPQYGLTGGYPCDEPYRDYWLLENFDAIFDARYLEKEENRDIKNCLEQLEKLAKLTHTIGNYMPCLDRSYNGIKGNYNSFEDRLDLMYLYARKYSNWFAEQIQSCEDKYYIKDLILPKEFGAKKYDEMCYKELEDYLEAVNNSILVRGKKMAEKMFAKLSDKGEKHAAE